VLPFSSSWFSIILINLTTAGAVVLGAALGQEAFPALKTCMEGMVTAANEKRCEEEEQLTESFYTDDSDFQGVLLESDLLQIREKKKIVVCVFE